MKIFAHLIEELKEENLLEETIFETSTAEKAGKKAEAAEKEVAPENIAAEYSPIGPLEEKEEDCKLEQNEADFYRQRAINEVAFLQIVEHVFAGVEREQLKIAPNPYDDLEVKKVLHSFLQLSPDADANARSKAEFQLMQETESWHSSLTLRDERLTTAHLRRYCETSRPPLSSTALVALARFYRNSPYSEPVRNKFDLVVTRLFSKKVGKSRREMVFGTEELAAHLAELYAEWSSVSLYSDEAEIQKIVQRFENFRQEAIEAVSFDELIKSDFFTRLHSFKRTTNENFYAPAVTACGIESNIIIGNRYIELLEEEKQRAGKSPLEDKNGFEQDRQITAAAGKTLSLIELLNEKKPVAPRKERPSKREPGAVRKKPAKKHETKQTVAAPFSKKWLIVAAAAILIITAIYFGTKPAPSETRETTGKSRINLENSLLKAYLTEARVEDGMLIGTVAPTWRHLTEEKRKEALKQMLTVGGELGYKKIQLRDKESKTIAAADAGNVLVFD